MKIPNRPFLPTLLAGLCLSWSATSTAQSTLIWSDEFDGDRIDRSTWTFTTGGSGNGNGELQFYTAASENAYLDDGKLVIEARRETMEGKEFTSARLHTNGRMAFKYGTIEARIKLPRLDNGLWPAFWMLGNNFGIDGWPKSGEWDILEAGYKSAIDEGTVNNAVSGAMHWWHETGTWGDWLQADAAADVVLPFNLYDEYHNYRLSWTPTEVTMSVDDTTYFTMDITDPNMSEFRTDPAHIILNLAVGGFNFVEITDPAQITAPFPAKMMVEYVRLYENEYTELHLAEDNLPSGNFGISTETTPVLSELNWGDRTNLYIWNNMTAVATTPSEGSSALAYQIQPGDWWGMGLLHRDYNMRNYVHGYLHLDIKTTSTSNFSIGMASTSGGDASIEFAEGGEQYGLVRDGEWHHVAIPLSKFGGVDFETVKTFFSISGPAPSAVMDIAVDNIYLSESIELPAPEFGNFGIYTENPAHRDAGDFGFGVNGDLFLWDDTLTLEVGNVLEGNASLNLKSTGKGWYGMGLAAREGFNLTAFDNPDGKLHFSLKTTDQGDFQIGIKSGNVNVIGQKWIYFKAGNDPYGFARDGQWHEIVIPVAELAKDLDLFDVRQLLQVLGTGEITSIAIDDVYLSGGQAAKDPGHNGPVVNRAPTAAVKPSVMGGPAGLTVDFDGSKSNDVNGDALTYSWDFGDGTTGSGANASHTYADEGTYTVTLTVSDGELSASAKTFIFVDADYGQTKSDKRGLGYGHHSVEDFEVISKGISWWYNWSHRPDVMIEDVLDNYGVEFAPMAWNGAFNDQAMRDYIAGNPNVKYILAFNEPNFIDQANMTPSQAAAEWYRLEAIADEFDLKIVSVAMNFCGNCVTENGTTYYDPIDYFDDFFAVCPDCRVDAISIHAYMEDVGGVEWYVNLFKKYNRPIWMTEFSAWNDTTTLEDQKRFLIQTVDYFENDDDVERYAWFTGRRNGHPYNGLFDYRQSGVLNELGSIYVNMPVHGDESVHNLPSRVEAENYASMSGIRPEQTTDANGFLSVTNVEAGDWIEYNIISTAGDYGVAARVTSEVGGTIDVLIDGQQVATIDVAATADLQTWETINATLTLPAGSHKLRLVFNSAIQLNWVDFATGNDDDDDNEPTPTGNLALDRPVFTSSSEGGAMSGAQAVDGNTNTRWASGWSDAEWIYVDLGASYNLTRVVLNWEAAYGRDYQLQVSDDASQWTTVKTLTGGTGGVDSQDIAGSGRYLRMLGDVRGTGYGYSLWEMEIYGTTATGGSSSSVVSSVASSSSSSSSVVSSSSSSVASSISSSVASSSSSQSSSVVSGGNLAVSKPVVASSTEGGVWAATYAVDGNAGTRWSSEFSDNQWIYVDLGSSRSIMGVVLSWEGAFGRSYEIQVSDDASQWTTVHTEVNGDGGIDDIPVSASGRYVRMLGTQRGTGYGYSLWEFEVY